MTGYSLQIDLPADRTTARQARDAVRNRLDGLLPGAAMDDLVLAVSEMVTMVLRAATEPTISLRVRSEADVIRVEVHDGPTNINPGLGGQVLKVLSARWGVDSAAPSVWAEITRR